MPLYFILSGLFFKEYGFKTFILKKTNKLLIPYIFFYVVTGVLIPVAVYRFFRHSIVFYSGYGLEAILSIFSERVICNPSIWFLLCLFEVNLLFYLLYFIAERFKHSTFILGILSFAVGMFGLFLAYKRIKLPYFIDSSFTAVAFFFFGYFLRNHTSILTTGNTRKTVCLSVVFLLVSAFAIHFFNYCLLSMFENTAGGLKGCAQVYPYGVMGTMSVLLLSKMIGKIPVLTYLGRYSIIVLCTHVYVLHFVNHYIRIAEGTILRLFIVFLITVAGCLVLIPLFKRYLAYFTAQKDLIRIK